MWGLAAIIIKDREVAQWSEWGDAIVIIKTGYWCAAQWLELGGRHYYKAGGVAQW